jgi:hypothetical protein
MIDSGLWQKGFTFTQYVNQMKKYQKEMCERQRDLRITPSECQKLKLFTLKRKILVMSEDWCIDSLMNLPILAKMAECAPNIELRIFNRSENPELTDFFSRQLIENIPVFWIMDDEFNQCGYWVERPSTAYKKIERWKQENPEFDLIKQNVSLTPDELEKKLTPYLERFLDDMWNLYDTGLQSDTINEICAILQK